MPFILTTPLGLETSVNFDEVSPGSSYRDTYGQSLELVVKNTDNVARTSHAINAVQQGTHEAYEYVRFSLDDTTFVEGPLSLGEFTAGEEKTIYLDAEVPVDGVTGQNKRFVVRLTPDE